MHIEYLEEFIELAQCLNFTEAARMQNIAQSALSKHLVVLEREMQAELIKRTRHSVELTQAGHALLQDAFAITERYRLAKQHVSEARSLPPLRIGGIIQNPHVLWRISSALADRSKDNLSISCTYNQSFSTPFEEMLRAGDIDLAFTYLENVGDASASNAAGEDNGLCDLPLYFDPFVAVVKADHPLASLEALRLKDLRDHKLVRLSGPYYLPGWNRIRDLCVRQGFEPRFASAFLQPGLDYSLIDLEGHVLILSQSALTGQLFARMDSIRCMPFCEPDVGFHIGTRYRADDTNVALAVFLERLRPETA